MPVICVTTGCLRLPGEENAARRHRLVVFFLFYTGFFDTVVLAFRTSRVSEQSLGKLVRKPIQTRPEIRAL